VLSVEDKDFVPRSVRLADFMVVFSSFVYNLSQTVTVLTEELNEIAIYHANRKTQESRMWEKFTNDLETIPEDTDGA
jgi:hypothetical protein